MNILDILKGVNMKKIKDLRGKINFVVKLKDPELKAGKVTQWETYGAHSFPKTFIYILSIQGYTNNTCQITYFGRGGKRVDNILVPSDMEVKLISEKIPARIYDNYVRNNLHIHVKRMGMSIGSDPEMFVEDENGVVIPAFNFLSSKAEGKHKTYDVTYGNMPLYWDGFQAEFETSAQTCLGWHTDSVQAGLKGLLIAARAHNAKAKISAKTVHNIPPEMLKEAKEEHAQFGCMPSKNAYGMKGSQADGRSIPFRPAGGHIHFGINAYNKPYTEDDYTKMVKALDKIIGVACVSLFANYDNPKRRELYGLAGEYRTPKHGLEYRVLSNAWLFHPMIMNLVFDVARSALTMGHRDLIKYWEATEEETVKCINTCDVELSREILKRNKKVMLEIIKSCYNYADDLNEVIFGIFLNGMESAVVNPEDIEGNWTLLEQWVTHSGAKGKNVGTASQILLVDKKKVA